MSLTREQKREAEKYFWLLDYRARARTLNEWSWNQGLKIWLANCPQCLDDHLLTEPFRDNLPANCIDEIDKIIQSRDCALRKIYAAEIPNVVARVAFSDVPKELRSPMINSALSPTVDQVNMFLISQWVVMSNVAKTEDGPMLIPGLAFHTDQSRADEVTRQTKQSFTAIAIRQRWRRLGLISVTKNKTPNLAAYVGCQISWRPIRSKKRS